MNKDYYKPIPCGQTIPLNNPHAFSVSMPTIKDVIDYEEGRECSRDKIKTAYPRIVTHPYIYKICRYIEDELNLVNCELFLLPNLDVAKEAARISKTEPTYYSFKQYTVAAFSLDSSEDACNYFAVMKHCGFMVFSREAKDILNDLGLDIEVFNEKTVTKNPLETIIDVLSEGYHSEQIIISSSGMNSIYTGFNEVQSITSKKGRELFILFGWAYADTIHIIKKCSKEYIIIPDVNDTDNLFKLLKSRGNDIAGVFIETVSNPLIEVPDIPLLHKLSLDYNFYLMIDNTFATPWNVDISPYCDIIFESLTKFASGAGDVMAGATIIPEHSRLNRENIANIHKNSIPLYIRDKERLAFNILGYKERMTLVSINSKKIENALSEFDSIESIYSVNNQQSFKNWNKISINNASCGVISIIFKKDAYESYDTLKLPKGPSLGTTFPLLMPYTLLAHYHETKTEKGIKYLTEIGLTPDLFRLSIGADDPDLTINAFTTILGL